MEAASKKTNHGVISFVIPKLGIDTKILNAQFALYLEHSTTTTSAAVGVYRVTSE